MQGTTGNVRGADWHRLAEVAPNEHLTVVLLQSVVDELDMHKSSNNKTVRRLARCALREIDQIFVTLDPEGR